MPRSALGLPQTGSPVYRVDIGSVVIRVGTSPIIDLSNFKDFQGTFLTWHHHLWHDRMSGTAAQEWCRCRGMFTPTWPLRCFE